MAFQARKTRERRKPDPVAKGKPLPPSAAIRVWYDRQLTDITNAMLADYEKEINEAFDRPEVEHYYAQDAAANDFFQFVFKRLQKKWSDIYKGFAAKYATEFVDKIDTHSKAATWFSLSAAGVRQPKTTYTTNVENILGGSVDFNHTLITGIQQDLHDKLYKSIMLSVTSTVPERQGSSGIQNALKEAKIFSKDRIDLITRDQTSKINASLSSERMKQNGVTHFEWMHSSAGKVPRESHVKMDGEIFEVDDPRLWQVGGEFGLKKGDLGPPGWAINCRCRAKPVIGFDDDED